MQGFFITPKSQKQFSNEFRSREGWREAVGGTAYGADPGNPEVAPCDSCPAAGAGECPSRRALGALPATSLGAHCSRAPGGCSRWLHFGVTTPRQHTVVQNEACLGLSLMSEDQTAWGPQVLIRLEPGWHFHKSSVCSALSRLCAQHIHPAAGRVIRAEAPCLVANPFTLQCLLLVCCVSSWANKYRALLT